MNLLQDFKNKPFIEAVQSFFKNLNVPVNEISTAPATAIDIIGDNPLNNLISEVYAYGIVDDAIFEQNKTFNNLEDIKLLKTDYDGILIFGITLHPRENYLLPTRTQLADITRAFSRTFKHTPLTIVFKYGNHIAFANSERTQFKQAFRDGEKIGKVSLLRDIDFINVHTGHEKILNNLTIDRSGKNAITNFDTLYKYWQEVLSVSILNKTFYNELSNWYFWAIKEVQFPNEPIQLDFDSLEKYDEAVKEHKGKNVIRLLTRILFIWFIKEKGLIPEDIFDEKEIASQFIDGFTPQKPEGMFANGKHSSKYYRAILQNLFFATLNQERNKRQFRIPKSHLNVTQLMRYEDYLKDPMYFLDLMKATVPFMNGGLFECLDKPHPTAKGSKGGDIIIYTDGFSDREDNNLVVPDFLFFDADEEVDLSKDYGSAKFKKSKTRGLIAILKSYKFTITENTPIDEDVALDPELLGKVFENLLASYNPETKTTARKQTGSFYTPREIVNYMVEESLIAYLKNELLHEDAGIVEIGKTQIALFGNEVKKSQLSLEQKIDESPFKGKEKELVIMLHQLVSYSNINPFEAYPDVQSKIIKALDNCKILDPACGSGAYPMGILQKMVHILHKIDPNNTEWKQRQIDRVNKAIEELELNDSTVSNEKSIKELKTQINDIESSFENNELDYGRKLYLIENCIYGVDIQPIATQISKLRFFISLVVDQKVDKTQKDFGIRPLPNLETKFVAANTLIGLDKPKNNQASLFDKKEVQKLENKLKKVRHSLFSIKSPGRKRELREQDKALREQISNLLSEDYGNETARLLANWDPYDQNTSSSFFDKEWMFDINDGFDIVIGNPPYIKEHTDRNVFNGLRHSSYYQGKMDLWYFFASVCIDLLKPKGIISFIATNNWITNSGASKLRNKILTDTKIIQFIDFSDFKIFESAGIQTMILLAEKNNKNDDYTIQYSKLLNSKISFKDVEQFLAKEFNDSFIYFKSKINKTSYLNKTFDFVPNSISYVLNSIERKRNFVLDKNGEINSGIDIPQDSVNKSSLETLGNNFKIGDGIFVLSKKEVEALELDDYEKNILKPLYTTKELFRFDVNPKNRYWIIYTDSSFKNLERIKTYPKIKAHLDKFQSVITSENKPYGLNRSRDEKYFKGERILIQRKCPQKPSFVYVDFDSYVNRTFIPLKTDRINLKYLYALLNSKMCEFWLRNKGKMQGDNFQVDKDPVLSIPIFKPELKNKKPFIDIVNQILDKKKQNQPTNDLESKIDLMVYKLYELTYDEVLIIEPEFSVNATDYENYKL